jgi:hypothetical protein
MLLLHIVTDPDPMQERLRGAIDAAQSSGKSPEVGDLGRKSYLIFG